MIKTLSNLLIAFILITTIYSFNSSKRIFQAKFTNVEGLPLGASVTALGVRIGEVVRTDPDKDNGVIVTVKITNKSVPIPPPGSRITITSFKPGAGNNLEIIYPSESESNNKAWLVQEPISLENWLFCSFEILEGLKKYSQKTIEYLTPENITKIRKVAKNTSDTLRDTADALTIYENNLSIFQKKLSLKGEQAKLLLNNLKGSISSLNDIVNDEEFIENFKEGAGDLTKDLNTISVSLQDSKSMEDRKKFKENILDKLNQISIYSTSAKDKVSNPKLKQNIVKFNNHIKNLNDFYETLNEKDIKTVTKNSVAQAKENSIKINKVTAGLIE